MQVDPKFSCGGRWKICINIRSPIRVSEPIWSFVLLQGITRDIMMDTTCIQSPHRLM